MSAPSKTPGSETTSRDEEPPGYTAFHTERKLVAILVADVKGFSRLMGEDEEATLRLLTTYRDELMVALVQQHKGQVYGLQGDSFLALFPSVVAAVQCAVEIQQQLKDRNAALPGHRRIEFRIGINLGDVIIQGEQTQGDGVNIAARLESIAEAGGVCIAGSVYEQVKNRLALQYEDLGEHSLKNIVDPVRVYRVQIGPKSAEVSRRQPDQFIFFAPFRLDVGNACLWRGTQRIPLTPKDFAVLHYLAERPAQLVTHEELLQAVWPRTVVGQGVLKVCMRRIRQALNDTAMTPRFIETVHRRGYRFIAPLTTAQPGASSQYSVAGSREENAGDLSYAALRIPHSAPILVGREAESQQLHARLAQAVRGERQLVFITGEPGIGKTTVVNAFLEHTAATNGIVIGQGQCIEHYGAGEAYLPVLEALGRLCRASGGERLAEWLEQHAPTWLVQMPALLSPPALEALQRRVIGSTRERMLREMLEAVEVLTVQRPLVLVLEDLHWGDHSTLELLAAVARRQEAARLMVIGTYRPEEMLGEGHPLKGVIQELCAHALCTELALGLLGEAEVAEYLHARFPVSSLPTKLAKILYQRTEGNPLFLVSMVDDWVDQGMLIEVDGRWALQPGIEAIEGGIPTSIRHLVAKQSERLLPAEQRVLRAASVARMEFSTAAVAAALEADVAAVEEWCAGLAVRQHFLRPAGIAVWPDGTEAACYGFIHALYQQLWHEQVNTVQRQRWHLRIGERKEAAYGDRTGEIAAELAVHFEQGRDYERAVRYLLQAAGNALRRSACEEAVTLLTKGLALLKALPTTPQRPQQELLLQTTLGPALMATKGYADSTVERAYMRAMELCQQVGEASQLALALRGLWAFYVVRVELEKARELGEQLLHLAQSQQDTALLLEAHYALVQPLTALGEFTLSLEHCKQGVALYDTQQHRSLAFHSGQDPGAGSLSFASFNLWFLGYPDQALQMSHKAIALARDLPHPLSLAQALIISAWLHQWRGEEQLTRERAEAAIAISLDQGFPFWAALGAIMRGWVLTTQGQEREGIRQIQQGLANYRAMGAEAARTYILALLSEVYGRIGQVEEGLTALAEALTIVQKTGDRWYEAELYRLKGELMLQHKAPKEAEEYFHKALITACHRGAKSLKLRAVLSLSRLWQRQGKKKAAQRLLAESCGWFTEGFDTRDLQEARMLLKELSSR